MAVQGPPSSLHDDAVDAQTAVAKLATGLAHAGVDHQAVQQLTAMSDLLSQIVKVLGEGPSLDQSAGTGAPPQGGPPPGPPQGGPPPGPPQGGPPPGPPQGGPPQGGPPGGGPPPAHEQMAKHSLQAATHSLHASMIASKQQREQGGQ